jgi:hypothetical protein
MAVAIRLQPTHQAETENAHQHDDHLDGPNVFSNDSLEARKNILLRTLSVETIR